MNDVIVGLELLAFFLLPVFLFLWGLSWWRRDREEIEHLQAFETLDPSDPKFPEKRIMEAAAICEQRRHGRRRGGGPIVVEWDTRRNYRGREGRRMVQRGDYLVAVTAEWLEREGPKNGIEVRRK